MFTETERRVLSKYWIWQKIMRADSQKEEAEKLSKKISQIISESEEEEENFTKKIAQIVSESEGVKSRFKFFDFENRRMALYIPTQAIFWVDSFSEAILKKLDSGELAGSILNTIDNEVQREKAKKIVLEFSDLVEEAKKP